MTIQINHTTDTVTPTTGTETISGNIIATSVTSSNGIFINSKTVSTSTTIPSGSNGQSIGPITIAAGQAVTVGSGSRWLIL